MKILISSSLTALTILAGIIANYFLVRILSVSEMGMFSVFQSFSILLFVFCSFGSNQRILRIVSIQRSKIIDQESREEIFNYKFFQIISFFIFLIIFCLTFKILNLSFLTNTFLCLIFSLCILFRSLNNQICIIYSALNRVVISQILTEFLPISIFFVSVVFLYKLGNGFLNEYQIVCTIFTLSIMLTFMIGLIYALFTDKENSSIFLKIKIKSFLKIKKSLDKSKKFFLINAFFMLIQYCDIILVSFLLGDFSAGLYKISLLISTPWRFGSDIVSTISGPIYSRLSMQSDEYDRENLVKLKKRIKLLFSLNLISFLVFLTLSKKLTILIFGDEYLKSLLPAFILILNHIIISYKGPANRILSLQKNGDKIALKFVMISFIIKIILCFLLIPVYGLLGIAISTLISATFINISSWLILKKNYKILI